MDAINGTEVLDELATAVIILDREGIIRYANRQVGVDLAKSLDRIVGEHCHQVFTSAFVTVYNRLLRECENGGKYSGIFYWAERSVWEQISGGAFRWEAKPCVLLTIANVTELARSEFQMETVTYYDSVLRLPNGARLEEDIEIFANVETVALVYLEIKNFQDVNELYGWDKGDLLLKQVRDWLLASESHPAQLYRVNNGFAILCRKATMDDALDRVREVQRRFKTPWAVSAGGKHLPVYLSANIGIVHGKYVKNEMRNLLLRTIRATERSGGGFAVYDEEADRKAKQSIVIRDNLIACVSDDMRGFEVHYQPIVDAATRRWVAVEALCRWTAPNGERVSPVDFIRTAEQLNLIDHLDAWVRQTAMQQCASLGLGRLDFTLDVNFSPTQRLDKEFVDALISDVAAADFPAAKLNIEITESTKMVFDRENIQGLMRIKEHGIGLSLDDFGTGHSSMENLMKISADAIKTEKLFMDGIEEDPSRQYLLQMLVDLAHHHGLHLIAEGVETESEFALAKQYGVDRVQGYLFSKPLSFEQLQKEAWRFQACEEDGADQRS